MSITAHERPGVYSDYIASSVVSGNAGRKRAGLAAQGIGGEARTIGRYEEAAALDDATAAEMARLLLQNGAAQVVVFPVAGDTLADYQAAFAEMAAEEDLAAVLCDSTELTVQQALRQSVTDASAQQKERIAVVAGAAEETVSELVERAEALNCERMVLAAPDCVDGEGEPCSGLPAAAAVAGVLAGQSDPAVPLGGAQVLGLYGLARRYSDSELDVEHVSGSGYVVRGVTTRTKTEGVYDATWRDLNAVLVADDVIPAIRNSLKTRFRRAKNTPQSRGAIRSQVILELEAKKNAEIITRYGEVSVSADTQEPTRCLVDFSFTVTHGINQIWLSAQITV